MQTPRPDAVVFKAGTNVFSSLVKWLAFGLVVPQLQEFLHVAFTFQLARCKVGAGTQGFMSELEQALCGRLNKPQVWIVLQCNAETLIGTGSVHFSPFRKTAGQVFQRCRHAASGRRLGPSHGQQSSVRSRDFFLADKMHPKCWSRIHLLSNDFLR